MKLNEEIILKKLKIQPFWLRIISTEKPNIQSFASKWMDLSVDVNAATKEHEEYFDKCKNFILDKTQIPSKYLKGEGSVSKIAIKETFNDKT